MTAPFLRSAADQGRTSELFPRRDLLSDATYRLAHWTIWSLHRLSRLSETAADSLYERVESEPSQMSSVSSTPHGWTITEDWRNAYEFSSPEGTFSASISRRIPLLTFKPSSPASAPTSKRRLMSWNRHWF